MNFDDIPCYIDKDIVNEANIYQAKECGPKQAIGKKHALKKYDQFALNTSCFLGSTGSNVTSVVPFHEFFVIKIMKKGLEKIIYYYCAKIS